MSENHIEAKDKNELKKSNENTKPEKVFTPEVDIYENETSLFLVANMPGVQKEAVDISLDNNILRLTGRINNSEYEELKPIYSEYNIGHYERSFELGSQVDQDKIEASMVQGVLNLMLPKVSTAQKRNITVK